MLPSLLARDIETGLKNFLVAAFEASDPFMHGLMARFVESESLWLKGPYVQVGLPFTMGQSGRNFFSPDFETEHPAFSHQEQAWRRISTRHEAASTIVATGTGSGKTECFLYPVLDHCARACRAGEGGIKALVIYPMNALANDQAKRIAELVAKVPAFHGLRVGLYVGGNPRGDGTRTMMTPESVITDRETLRKQPPDILLTNYKMLDYLLLRPADRALWAQNGSETLRYVVVDELHTFDGAQGTDLALLLRRVRARLKADPEKLIVVGTSATLGSGADTAPLREYARQVFGVPFGPDAVITENRISVSDFLGDATVDYTFSFAPGWADTLVPNRYREPADAVKAWFPLFFVDAPAPDDARDKGWRVELGRLLKRHQLFVNLLKLLRNGVASYDVLVDGFRRSLPGTGRTEIRKILDALLALAGWALRENGQPLVTLRVQLWLRELRRMVGRIAVNVQDVRLVSDRDLPAHRDGVYLPMVQCRQCRTTGWISRKPEGSSRLSTKLEEIYNIWFSRRPETARIYAAGSVRRPLTEGINEDVCPACGNLQPRGKDSCLACGNRELLPVFRVTATQRSARENAQFTLHDTRCPACGERDELQLLGAQTATLGAVIVETSWASPFNDDKRMIAFSDSVQDAAHRAGFFTARTYKNNVRTAWSQVMDELGVTAMPWPEFIRRARERFSEKDSILCMSSEELVSEFLPPDLAWHRDWEKNLRENGRLPTDSRLPEYTRKRLFWELFSDLTYMSQRGRTLERTGKAVLAVPWSRIQPVAEHLAVVFREHFGTHGLEPERIAQWLWGMLARMRQRGGVMTEELTAYASDGDVYALTRLGDRAVWMPRMGPHTPRPVFVTLGRHQHFDRLTGSNRPTWYERWTELVLSHQALMDRKLAADLCMEAVRVLCEETILLRNRHHLGESLALNPDALVLYANRGGELGGPLDSAVAFIATERGERRLAVPREDAKRLLNMPCLDAPEFTYENLILQPTDWWAWRYSHGDLRRVIAAEHTGLLEREEREDLERRFKADEPNPWDENLLSATPTLEMGVDIGKLSSVMLCSVPPNQASFLQRVGRAGRRDGNALAVTLASGNSPHDLYFFSETEEMIAGDVASPGVFLRASEVLRRQLFAYCMDDWVGGLSDPKALPDKTSKALDAIEKYKQDCFPYTFIDHVRRNEQRLFEGFMALLGKDEDETVRSRLLDYIQGQGETNGMGVALYKILGDLVKERNAYQARRDELDKAIRQLQQQPQDEATEKEIEDRRMEREKLTELIREINNRDLLETLTDFGLIPNYAFPETGVELKSVLWRRRSHDESGKGKYVAVGTLKYERPARSALSEFAPENRFYANQRRVEVDQINMNLATIETWRFCPSCPHVQNLLVEPDVHPACPRCNDPMWADAAQKRTLLRFRQAIATSDDRAVRIDDSAEDREPRFYQRQMLASFRPEHVRIAWKIADERVPFGFEFISRVVFRDINFGELARPGDKFRVADKDAERPGFRLCRHCGRVQKPPRGRQPNGQSHSLDCPMHGSEDPDNILECLYLYREFESEALRILIPYTKSGVDERVVQSFMAALQLGLKRRFGGRVDHLQMMLQDEPGRDGGPRRHYVMLYDSVPGGTGYLHQLLANGARTLIEVLQLALDSLKECSCNDDPEKDGCYRCLYQYRLGRSMELVSRNTAKEVLGELVGALGSLERVDTIDDILINPNFDSVLELRFIESLRRLGGVGGLPQVRIVQDIVHGKAGWVLEVGDQRYRVEPQCELGSVLDLPVWSKPDFVIWPWSEVSKRKPIAVFCDGWSDHQNSLREDALKRSAIVASGRCWVWSVTYDDVQAGLAGRLDHDIDPLPTALGRHAGEKMAAKLAAESSVYTWHAVAALLAWLARPASARDPEAVDQLQRNALWLAFRMIPEPNTGDAEEASKAWENWLPCLPEQVREPGDGHARVISLQSGPVCYLGNWPLAWARPEPPEAGWRAPGVAVLDDTAQDPEQLHLAWRSWLQLFNALQFLPGVLMVTKSGLENRDYDVLGTAGSAPAAAGPKGALAAWEGVLQEALAAIRPGLLRLAEAGAGMPTVGIELSDDGGRVVAEAELAWPEAKLAVLRADQEDLKAAWQTEGWQVIVLDESLATVDGRPWEIAVATAFGLVMESEG